MKRILIICAIVAGLALVFTVGVFVGLPYTPPDRRVTVGQQALASNARPRMVTINTGPITQATSFIGGYDWASEGYSTADVYYSIDQTSVNTTTLALQVSPDDVTWMDHSASSGIVGASAADATGYVGGIAVHLPYFRITAAVSNTNVVTPTIKVYLR